MQEQEDRPHKFSRTKENVLCNMELLPANDLRIDLLYCETRERYTTTMTEGSIREDPELWKYFESPREMLEELTANFEQVQFQAEGKVTYSIKIGKKKKVPIDIQLAKVEAEEGLESKKMIELSQKYSNLEQQYLQLKVKYQQLEDRCSQLENKIKQLSLKNTALEQVVNKTEKGLTTFMNISVQQQKKIKNVSLNFSEMDYQLRMQQSRINNIYGAMHSLYFKSPLKNVHQIVNLVSHPDHPNSKIDFKYEQQSRTLKKIGEKNDWVNFITNMKINGQSIYFLDFEIIKTVAGKINLGIGGKNMFGNANIFTSKCFSSYSFYFRQYIYEGVEEEVEERQKGNYYSLSKAKAGDKIRMVIDTEQNIVSWFRMAQDGSFWLQSEAESIQQHMRGQQLFPIITMFDRGDTLRVMSSAL